MIILTHFINKNISPKLDLQGFLRGLATEKSANNGPLHPLREADRRRMQVDVNPLSGFGGVSAQV
jgi:hypothetical protein